MDKEKHNKLSRKEALKKGGEYAALTAATIMMLLPTKAHAAGSGDLNHPIQRDSDWRNS